MKKEEEKTTKRRKKKGKIGYIGIFLLVFVVYIVINIVLGFSGNIRTVVVRKGVDEEKVSANAYIFREQTIVNAPQSGFIYCEAREDERVKSGEAIVSIYKNEINSQANSELASIDEKIKKLSGDSLEVDVYSNDVARVEQDISKSLRNVPLYNHKKNIEYISEIREAVDVLIGKKRVISGRSEPISNEQELEKLKARKAEIETENSVDRTIVHAPKTGSFTARIDGLEEILSLSAVENITPSYLKDLDKREIEAKTAAKVEAGEAIGKIVNNFKWCAASVISKEDAESIKIGDSIGIRFVNIGSEIIQGTVTKITAEEKGKVAIVVTSNKYIDRIYSTSRAEVEYIKESYSGYRIPAESIRIVNGVKGVYVIRNDIARFVPIETSFRGKENVIVKGNTESNEGLKLYDELIVSGRNIYDGKGVR